MQKKSVFFISLIISIILLYSLNLEWQAKATVAITFFAMCLWIFEVIPLHATALLVGFLLITVGKFNADKVFAQYFDKVVVLVLGGFALAAAMSKHKLDSYIAKKFIRRFNNSSTRLLLGVITVTAFLSMWMSNSAAASIVLPVIVFIIAKNKLKNNSNLAKSLVLGVAYGATIGGIGTIIGSTPNVFAQKFLTAEGIKFGFWEWGIRGFPFMIILIILCWLVLLFLFKPDKKIVIEDKNGKWLTPEQKKVTAVFGLIILLWITESLHGIHNSVVALLAVILLYLGDLLDTKDFQKMGWDSLILIGGGIALGMAIMDSGIAAICSNYFAEFITGQHYFILLLAIGTIGVTLTSFLSNTAASAIIIPVVTSLAGVLNVDMTNLVVASAIGVSMDFIFPMGTPPSALAYSSGYIKVTDLIKAGVLLSLLGIFALAGFSYFW